MPNLSARLSTPSAARNLLSFNDIKYKAGKYRNTNTGNILVVFSNVGKLVSCGTDVTSSGQTRTNMFMVRSSTRGGQRTTHVKCGPGEDGNRVWEPYTGTVTL